ncbi:hypothetical protein [Dokdonella immobilis]|uniref:Uncharacterized protein n=1 Tax=Dokdonella immobilis TaxID=578942 RepID=A0A1I4WTA7_9GAMM|nr:hypothetical protein [Dokdonella immobilis]SFN16582.1 hypothetical protein SAMN05216289_1067 [Dokdonella immobilis]
MVGTGSLIARDSQPRADGSVLAVLLHERPPYGFMAWAGYLLAEAIDKAADDITLADYGQVEKVSFCRWDDVWEYFADREYAPLVQILREQVGARPHCDHGAGAQPAQTAPQEPIERTRS